MHTQWHTSNIVLVSRLHALVDTSSTTSSALRLAIPSKSRKGSRSRARRAGSRGATCHPRIANAPAVTETCSREKRAVCYVAIMRNRGLDPVGEAFRRVSEANAGRRAPNLRLAAVIAVAVWLALIGLTLLLGGPGAFEHH